MSTMAMKLSERFFKLFDWRRNRSRDEAADSAGGLPVTTSRPQRESTLARLEEGYEQVLDVMASVKAHTREQAEHSERLMEVVRDVPEAVAQLRQVADTQKKMTALLQKQMMAHAEDREVLNGTLDRLAAAFDSEQAGLDAIAKVLADRERTDAALSDRLGGLGSTLGKLDETSQASTLMLRTLAERTKRADNQVRDLYDKGRRQMMLVAVSSLLVALSAVGVSTYAVLQSVPVSVMGVSSPGPEGGSPAVVPVIESFDQEGGSVTDEPVIVPSADQEIDAEMSEASDASSEEASTASGAESSDAPAGAETEVVPEESGEETSVDGAETLPGEGGTSEAEAVLVPEVAETAGTAEESVQDSVE